MSGPSGRGASNVLILSAVLSALLQCFGFEKPAGISIRVAHPRNGDYRKRAADFDRADGAAGSQFLKQILDQNQAIRRNLFCAGCRDDAIVRTTFARNQSNLCC